MEHLVCSYRRDAVDPAVSMNCMIFYSSSKPNASLDEFDREV